MQQSMLDKRRTLVKLDVNLLRLSFRYHFNFEWIRKLTNRSCSKISELSAEIRLRARIYLLSDSLCEKSVERLKPRLLSTRLQYIHIFYECPYAIIYCFFQCYDPNWNIKKDTVVSGFLSTLAHQTHFVAPSCVQVYKCAKLLLIFAQPHFHTHISTRNCKNICLHTQSLKKAILF